jgi:hypothetical protein
MHSRPDRTEAAEYYFGYIDQVPDGEICQLLETQGHDIVSTLRAISESQSLHRYAPDKWSIREVVSHLSDTERLFVFRAFWFARGFDSPLPSFDQNIAVANAAPDHRSWPGLVDEFHSVRAATLSLFRSIPAKAWSTRGVASGNPVTVRALAYMCGGHAIHHMKIIHDRYIPNA